MTELVAQITAPYRLMVTDPVFAAIVIFGWVSMACAILLGKWHLEHGKH